MDFDSYKARNIDQLIMQGGNSMKVDLIDKGPKPEGFID